MPHYRSFDLMISPMAETNSYHVRVLDSPAGQAAATFQLPAAVEPWQHNLSLVGGAIRAFKLHKADAQPTAEPLAPREFGTALFQALFRDDVETLYRRSLATTGQQQQGLRIRLRLDEAPALAALPWEYLYDPTHNRFLVLADQTPIVRYLALPLAADELTIRGPLRILVLTADANDVARLDVAGEEQRLRAALQPLVDRGDVEITWLPNGTLRDLRRALRRGEHHIFHFIGHGWVDEASQTYGLLFADEAGKGQQIRADQLAMTLHNHRPLRLAFLNACEGARLVTGEPFAGVAQRLLEQALPAAIAMQFPVSDQAALELAHEFYAALADGYPVEQALAQARLAILEQESVMEWGTPVLFMRADTGQLWHSAADAPAEAADSPPPQPNDRERISTGGGAYVRGNVNVGGEFVGRDKIVHGNEIHDNQADGDIIIATVGAGASNVAVGKHIRQENVGDATATDAAQIERFLQQTLTTVKAHYRQLDATQLTIVQLQMQLLQGELTKSGTDERASAEAIVQAGDWLLTNVPALREPLTALFTFPPIVRLLAKAGPKALAWQQQRF